MSFGIKKDFNFAADSNLKCRLCEADYALRSWQTARKPISLFHQCENCSYLQLDPKHFIDEESEKKRYSLHQNADPVYEAYLQKFANENIFPYADESSRILDFGCGPYPMLTKILQKKSSQVFSYDPFFQPTLDPGNYDLIVLHEVAEHLLKPSEVFLELRKILNPGAVLIVSTQFYSDAEAFEHWAYRRDPTHVGFFNEQTFRFLQQHLSLRILKMQNPVVVFQS